MKKSVTIIVGVVVLAAAAIGVYALTKKNSTSNETSSTATSDTTSIPEGTIVYSDTGFSPSSITVASGATITVENNSSEALQFDSDPHPAHTNNKELNQDSVLDPGETESFVVDKTGTWGYHNHLDPSKRGTIIVK